MRRVAHDANPASGVMIQRFSPQQRPFVGRIDVADDSLDVFVPVGEVAQAFLPAARLIPGFHAPIVTFHHADKIQDLAAPHRVSDDVTAGANPVDAHQAALMRRQTLHRNQAACSPFARCSVTRSSV